MCHMFFANNVILSYVGLCIIVLIQSYEMSIISMH